MRHKLELYRPGTGSDAFGDRSAVAQRFEFVRVVRAERVNLKGSTRNEAYEPFSDYTAQFRIRSVHPVDNGWRVRQLGGYLYAVNNVIPNEARGYLDLICSRINE